MKYYFIRLLFSISGFRDHSLDQIVYPSQDISPDMALIHIFGSLDNKITVVPIGMYV